MRRPSASARKSRPARRRRPVSGQDGRRKKRAATRPSRRRSRTATARARAERAAGAARAGAGASGARPEQVVHGGADAPPWRRPAAPAAASTSTASSSRADPLRFGPIGIGADPSDVYTVHYKNLAAVVSDAPLEVLDSTRENVLAHERVNETVMREHTVIPMSFGTIFKTREDIVELLRSAAEAFGDVLNKMQNKLEFGLKVLWDRDQAIREVEARGRGHQPAEEGDFRPEGADLLRPHAVRPADRLRRCSRAPSATSPRSSSSCATCRSRRASTSRSATR